jgi:hypothetical protein
MSQVDQVVPEFVPALVPVLLVPVIEDQVVPAVPVPAAPVPALEDQVVPIAPAPISLVQTLCTYLKEMRKGKYLIIPIKKICNINAEVTIHKESRNSYILNIGPMDFSVDDDSLYENHYTRDGTALSENDFIEYIVQNTLAALKTIKIDKLNGKFTTTAPSPQAVKTDAMWTAFCQEFKDEENMVLSLNECCVCFTVTKTTTNCEHSVCLDCISKLRTEAVAGEHNSNQKICPLCRQRILFLN